LLWAAAKKDLTMVKFLVEHGAQILKSKKDGLTILHIASSQGDIHVLDYAIKVKESASIDVQNDDVT